MSVTSISIAVACTLLVGVGTAPASAQERIVQLADPECTECGLSLVPLATLGATEGPAMLETVAMRIRRDSRGRFVLSDDLTSTVKVFESDGTFVGSVGGWGEGPGEFLAISAVSVSPGDSLYVFDPAQGRMSVFAPDLSLARVQAVPMPASYDAALVEAGWIVNANNRAPNNVGYPLHIIRPDGTVSSFGSRTGLYRPDVPYAMRRVVARAGPDEVWSGWLNQYAIERWDAEGVLKEVLTREADWFEPYWRVEINSDNPPATVLSAVVADDSLLWTMTKIADARWREAIEKNPADESFFVVTAPSRYVDTVVEVIDLDNRRVLWSHRFDEALAGFAEPGIVYGPTTHPDGSPLAAIWRIVREPVQGR
jgi:hypothetical protein